MARRIAVISDHDEHGDRADTTLRVWDVFERGVGGWKSFLTLEAARKYCADNNIEIEQEW